MRYSTCAIIWILGFILGFVTPAQCLSLNDIRDKDIVFVYVHGFCEFDEITAFEEKIQKCLQPLSMNAMVFTYRWDRVKFNLPKVLSQWSQSKIKADQAAKPFMDEVILKLEAEKIPYFIVAYSLGTRVVAESLRHGPSRLSYLRGIYFAGSALPHNYSVDGTCLPEDMKIISYYSPYMDDVLKFSFHTAEDVQAAGEIGFDNTTYVQNYRTVCSHINKAGPIQRDYSNLASAIVSLSLFKEGIFVKGKPAALKRKTMVSPGNLNWNDIIAFKEPSDTLWIQQNIYNHSYRAVAIDGEGDRVEKSRGKNLHSVLQKLNLFPPPYKRIIYEEQKLQAKP